MMDHWLAIAMARSLDLSDMEAAIACSFATRPPVPSPTFQNRSEFPVPTPSTPLPTSARESRPLDATDEQVARTVSVWPEGQDAIECLVCVVGKPLNEYFALSGCAHPLSICKECTRRILEGEIDERGAHAGLSCPSLGCPVAIPEGEMPYLVSRRKFDEWNESKFRAVVAMEPGFVACTNPNGCTAFQLVDDGETNNVVRCATCGWRTCFVHKSQMHLGLTCAQYDEWKAAFSDQDEVKTQSFIDSHARACPECASLAIKDGTMAEDTEKEDCNHMVCSICFAEWCWVCRAPYFGGDQSLRKRPVRVCVVAGCSRQFLHTHHSKQECM